MRLLLPPLKDLASRFTQPGMDPGFRLNLFDDADYRWTVQRLRVRPDGWVLWGRLEDAPQGGEVVMAFRDGYLAANIFVHGRGRFVIRYAGEDRHCIFQADDEKGFTCGTEADPSLPSTEKWDTLNGLPPLHTQDVSHGCPDSPSLDLRYLLVLYTPLVREEAGGIRPLLAQIDVAWASLNMAFYNSDIGVEMQLVRTQEVDYQETSDITMDLFHMSWTADGYMDEIPALKASSGADHVCLWVARNTGNLAGMAYLPGSLSVVLSRYGDLVMPHELGHNLGCHHDYDNSGITDPPYAHGHRFTAGGRAFITLMSYYPGERILHFSNPDILFWGAATGVPAGSPGEADNARVINDRTLANPYTGDNLLPDVAISNPDPGSFWMYPSALTLVADASDDDGSVVQVDFYSDNRYLGSDVSEPFTLSWSPPAGIHYVTAHAIDDAGGMRISCPVSIHVGLPTPTPTWTFIPVAIRFTPDTTIVPAITPIPCLIPFDRASVSSDATPANGHCGLPGISGDGRYVVFDSLATNLVPGDTNATWDVFLRDRLLGTTQLISRGLGGVPANGLSRWPSISGDGRIVAFQSDASNLVPGDTNGRTDLFAYDRIAGTLERISVGPLGEEGNHESSGYSAPSWDGRIIAFASWASNFTPGDDNNDPDLFVKDRVTGALECASRNADGFIGDSASQSPHLSAGGRYVLFESYATNLVAASYVGNNNHLFVYDRATGQHELIDRNRLGNPATLGTGFNKPGLSSDGRFVSYDSSSNDLVLPADSDYHSDVYLLDRTTLSTRRLSRAHDGSAPDDFCQANHMSGNGRYVGFWSAAGNLVPGMSKPVSAQFYVHDTQTSLTWLASRGIDGQPGNDDASLGSFSHSGDVFVFPSEASNLIADDTNNVSDEFVSCVQLFLPTDTATPTATPSPTPFTATATHTSMVIIDEFETFSPTPTGSSTSTLTPTPTPTETFTPSPTPSATSSSTPRDTSTPDDAFHLYPIPYDPDMAVGGTLKAVGMPEGALLKIFTVSGERVATIWEKNGRAEWNGRNERDLSCPPGIYYYLVTWNGAGWRQGKFVLSRRR